MRVCILCNTPTTGSVGRAGLEWPMICQPCKDREDGAVSARFEHIHIYINKARAEWARLKRLFVRGEF